MYKEVTIRRIGNSLGTTIPKKMLERHRLSQGDKVYIVETEQGLLITPYDPDFAQALDHAEETIRAYRDDLRELAK